MEQYRDGLQAGVQSLQDAYPDAEILIASSNFITAFDNGTAFNNDLDEILNDYVTGAEETAAAMNVFFLNTNEALQWNPQMLPAIWWMPFIPTKRDVSCLAQQL